MQTISRSELQDAVFASGLDEDAIYEDYSGRGMYGDKCFGIVADDVAAVVTVFAHLGDEAVELASCLRTDDMGMGMIAYFPGYQLAE